MVQFAVFPGQGSQYPGMGRDLLERGGESSQRILDRAVEILGPEIQGVMFEDESARLFDGYWSGLAVTISSISLWESYGHRERIRAAAGYSVGQFAALYASGVLTLENTLRVVAARGKFLREAAASNRSAMIGVVGLPPAKLQSIIVRFPSAQVSNFNAPGNYSVGCARDQADDLRSALESGGAIKAVVLPMEGAWHSDFMRPAAESLGRFISGVPLGRAAFPVYSNVTAEVPPAGDWKRHLVEHVSKPVLWQETILNAGRAGFKNYIEFGFKPQLANFIKFTDRSSEIELIGHGECT